MTDNRKADSDVDRGKSAPEQPLPYPTATGIYVCNVPIDETGERGRYGYVLVTGLDLDPSGPWVTGIGSSRRVHASKCTSFTRKCPAPAGRAHRAFGCFVDEGVTGPPRAVTQHERICIAEVLEAIVVRVREDRGRKTKLYATPMTAADLLEFARAMRLEQDSDDVVLASKAAQAADDRVGLRRSDPQHKDDIVDAMSRAHKIGALLGLTHTARVPGGGSVIARTVCGRDRERAELVPPGLATCLDCYEWSDEHGIVLHCDNEPEGQPLCVGTAYVCNPSGETSET